MAVNFVVAEGDIKTATQTLSGGGTVAVEQDALILPGTTPGLVLDRSPWTIKIDGTIQTTDDVLQLGNGFGAFTKASKITVGAEGTLFTTGFHSAAIVTESLADITNAGLIHGNDSSIVENDFVGGPKSFTITNTTTGEIFSDAVAIGVSSSDSIMTLKNQGRIDGDLQFAGGAKITNSGGIFGDILAATVSSTLADTITNSGTIEGNINFAGGDDILMNTGILTRSVTLSDGKNTFTNSGSLFFDLSGGTGIDTVTNSGMIGGDINLGEGANKLANSGTINGDIQFGSGADTVTNTKIIAGALDLGEGNNKLTNSGTIGSLSAGKGDDSVTNTKLIDGTVDLGDGKNSLTNGGTIDGSVSFGAGDDVFKNSGTVTSTILMGRGNDTFTGGNGAETVVDDFGNDTYNMGGGGDTLFLSSSGTDKADGGAGFDHLSAVLTSQGYHINLDSKVAQIDGVTIAAGTATDIGSNVTATVKGFEQVTGSLGADHIVGGTAAETLNGSVGNDFIAGGLGADTLDGGAGSDTFVYFKITDSGVTRTTRDKIDDFEGADASGGDFIDLSAFDVNPKTAAHDGFQFIGNNAAFNHIAGELRAVVQGSDLILEGDVNGDAKADFAITLIGVSAIASGDLVL